MLHSSYVLEITSRLECLYQIDIEQKTKPEIFSQFNGGDNIFVDGHLDAGLGRVVTIVVAG